jgi:hypothetical protein
MSRILFLLASFKRLVCDHRGQDLIEWTASLAVFLMLCGAIAMYFWVWWNQAAAAGAVHDGTYLAAIRGGSAVEGVARSQEMLESAVGQFANEYKIQFISNSLKSVRGDVETNKTFVIPFIGNLPYTIRAHSFQRLERFYGGPVGKRTANFWWW